ncbi:MAG: YidC/Oxa1 family membrane protein insertase [Patescibacteria group bacterium]|nr:YidC/Oxa1 family membrane protein insertase [Patescibacteria group bacterium]
MDIFTLIFTQPIANGLVAIYKLVGNNFGLAIIIFTAILLLITRPLTKPYMDSMKKMRDLAPDIAKLKKKHKNDNMKFIQAQAELYKQKGINPSAGCLPYLLQIVILIAFFNFFTHTFSSGNDIKAKLNELMYPPLVFSESDVISTKFLYMDLSKPDSHPVDGLPFALPGALLIVAAIVQFASSKMMMPFTENADLVAKKTKDETDDIQVAMQKSFVYMLPVMTILAGLTLPSGLALYWVTFSIYQMINQYLTSGWGGLLPFVNRIKLLLNFKDQDKL